MSINLISRAEETILLAVRHQGDDAYGVTIQKALKELTGKSWAYGALFVTLDRLVKKNLLTSTLSDPTPERGGRSKRFYNLTESAEQALQEVRAHQESLWAKTTT